ncbi:hypothetical protein [Pseudophaeobacter sp.]|uniref:hypothetical protein n=1 Tax=Pseudophaeobacter sp. TaxID=1971739 RepID=UPI00326502AC
MHRFDLNAKFSAIGSETSETRIGEIYQVRGSRGGSGSVSTPIARYFVWRPEYIEGAAPHWRIDCYFKKHKLAGDPKTLSRLLPTICKMQGSAIRQFGYRGIEVMKSVVKASALCLPTTN